MAKMTAAAQQPVDDEDDDMMGSPDGNQGTNDQESDPSDMDEQGGDDQDEGSKVIATILMNEDGSYTLIHGDEEDSAEGEGGEPGEDEDEGEAGGAGEESEAPYRETFDSEGALLKGVLDCIRKDKGESDEGAEQDFAGGYNEEKGPMQAPATAARGSM
jgi:hypothetical protein